MSSQDYFKENKYIKIEKFLDTDTANYFYEYVKMNSKCTAIMEETLGREVHERYSGLIGSFDDPQAPGDYSKYGDPAFDTLLITKMHIIEDMIGIKLTPTYTYHRLYTTGTELKRHKDRHSCEISTTLCLGKDTSNVEEGGWPMYIKNKDEETPIHLNPGDMIVYRGCEVEHWREPYKGLNHAQVFLHYNEKGGEYDTLYDGRPCLGLSAEFKKTR